MLNFIGTVLADGAGCDHMGGWGWFGMMFGWVVMASLVVVIAWALVGKRQPDSANRAIELLDERYARGEIDRDEYRERRKDLGR